MYLLDTNVLSELRRHSHAHPNVVAWASKLHPSELFLSAITILEIERGILLRERQDKAQGAVLRAWLDERVLPRFEGRILSIDTEIARRCAMLHVPNPRPHSDALVAATGLVHSLKLVTRNVADFEGLGLELINPWE
ncbi:MAG: type II toxin-antitoxin system VapC family toxin [Rhodospirillaceae bacterium]